MPANVMIVAAIAIAGWAARAEPTRHFVLVDQSGAFEPAIEQAVERAYQRSVMQAAGRYVRQHLRGEQRASIDLSAVPADGGPPPTVLVERLPAALRDQPGAAQGSRYAARLGLPGAHAPLARRVRAEATRDSRRQRGGGQHPPRLHRRAQRRR